MNPDPAFDALCRAARPLANLQDVDAVVDAMAGAHTVLLGEATHGTREFYALRAEISRRLIERHGFDALVMEADWPDMLRVHRWVQGGVDDVDARQALSGFTRFPRWMWRNKEIVNLTTWLRAHNDAQAPQRRAGIFGLDLYSLHGSIQAVLAYLQQHEPESLHAARERYGCFGHFLDDPQRYGHATHFGLSEGCQRQVLQQLQALAASAAPQPPQDSHAGEDELFFAQLNALVVRNAERYYRTMFEGSTASWNQRDRHMAQVLQRLREHLTRTRGRPARLIVWAHNSHLGDARATEMGGYGQLNLGQLVRESTAPGQRYLLGFTTAHGSVAAATDWDEPVQFMQVRPAREDSWEGLLHRLEQPLAFVPLGGPLQAALAPPRLERAIGVIYRPETERASHYFDASLSQQFDGVLHVDRSHALHPLDGAAPPAPAYQEAETYPSGL